MNILITVFELVSIAFGAGAALIFDCFFILSLKDHKLRAYEIRSLQRLSLYSIISASFAIFLYILLLGLQFETSTDLEFGVPLAKLLILSVALLSAITLRKIHLKTLVRYQSSYAHLSERMIEHQDSLIVTAAYSSFSWICIILLTAVETRTLESAFFEHTLFMVLTYILIGFGISKLALFVKKKIISLQ